MYIKDSDYFKVIQYLYDRHSDGQYHDIDKLLGEEQAYSTSEYYQQVLAQLYKDKLIQTKLGSGSSFVPYTMFSDGTSDRMKSRGYRPLEAKLTSEGVKWYNQKKKEEEAKAHTIIKVEHSPNTNIVQGNIIKQEKFETEKEPGPTKELQVRQLIISIIGIVIALITTLVVNKCS